MSLKRKLPHHPHPSASASTVHPSRQDVVPPEPDLPIRKKAKKANPFADATHGNASKGRPKKHTVNPIKGRIRDIKRLLQRADEGDRLTTGDGRERGYMDAGRRIGLERELQSLEIELKEAEEEILRQQMVGRYHMVRFFDRQKATRKLKKTQKQQSQLLADDTPTPDSSELEEAAKLVHTAEVDLNYTLFFPLTKAYVSLYPKKVFPDDGKVHADEEASAVGIRGDRAMWMRVEKCMADGKKTLEALRDGNLTRDTDVKFGPEQLVEGLGKLGKKKGARKGRERDSGAGKNGAERKEQQDEDSDDGFFEEDGGVAV
ncbi:hypothetical protein BJ546DRAFT_999648 [Cryomyces antarcticus]